jgi:hypothetical protein
MEGGAFYGLLFPKTTSFKLEKIPSLCITVHYNKLPFHCPFLLALFFIVNSKK